MTEQEILEAAREINLELQVKAGPGTELFYQNTFKVQNLSIGKALLIITDLTIGTCLCEWLAQNYHFAFYTHPSDRQAIVIHGKRD